MFKWMDDQRSIINTRPDMYPNTSQGSFFIWIYIYPFQPCKVSGPFSVIHLFWLVIVVLRFSVLNIIVALSISHRLVHVGLVLSLLHVQWEVLVVTIHICGICIWESLIQGNWSLDGLVFRVKDFGHVTLEFVSLGLNVFNCEANDCPSYLNGHGMLGLESQLLFQQDDRSELRGVVFNIETILLALNDRVTSTHTDVVDAYLTLVATSQFEF